jgi:hypothetical protein
LRQIECDLCSNEPGAVPDDKLPMDSKLGASAETLIHETPAAGVAMTSAPFAVLLDVAAQQRCQA